MTNEVMKEIRREVSAEVSNQAYGAKKLAKAMKEYALVHNSMRQLEDILEYHSEKMYGDGAVVIMEAFSEALDTYFKDWDIRINSAKDLTFPQG
jgi:predicted translin family RNA/ssDNA-binding protein